MCVRYSATKAVSQPPGESKVLAVGPEKYLLLAANHTLHSANPP